MNRAEFERMFGKVAEETGMSELVRVAHHVGAFQMMMLNLADFVCGKEESPEQKRSNAVAIVCDEVKEVLSEVLFEQECLSEQWVQDLIEVTMSNLRNRFLKNEREN